MSRNSYEDTQATLEQIASILGCPTSAFFGRSELFHAQTDALELLYLWQSIVQEDSRQKVLAYVRWIVKEQSSQ